MKVTPRLRNWALFWGIITGFGGAVVAGYQATDYSKPSHFYRFHQGISLEGRFYPPFSMLENLALAAWKPGRTVVIIGGNSILLGVGQTESELWSRELQNLLGESYAVVNLSFSGSYPSEAGALVAESLVRRGVPVIFVSNTAPGPVARPYESIYAYLFWDAFYKQRLLPNALRAAELAYRDVALLPEARVNLTKGRLTGRLDAVLRFDELWHHVAYRHFFTLWVANARDEFWRPRDAISDQLAASAPLDMRFKDNFDLEMNITRSFTAVYAETDGKGGWKPTEPSLQQAARDIEEIFTPPLRARMLILLFRNCPFYRLRLTPSEQARDDLVFDVYAKLWREHGIASLTVGSDFDSNDYSDRAHLSPDGGRKLARLVAAQVRGFPSP